MMDAIWQDLRFGVRVLATQRQFTAVAVLVLALGIGATTGVFSIVNAVLLRPLPYHEPERLVAISSVYESGAAPRTSAVVPLSDVAEWRSRSRLLTSMGGFAYTQLPMRVGNQSFSPVTALMDPQLLPTLGNPLAMGSYFAETPEAGSDMTAIVSHALWTEALGADPSAIGRAITVDGHAVCGARCTRRGLPVPPLGRVILHQARGLALALLLIQRLPCAVAAVVRHRPARAERDCRASGGRARVHRRRAVARWSERRDVVGPADAARRGDDRAGAPAAADRARDFGRAAADRGDQPDEPLLLARCRAAARDVDPPGDRQHDRPARAAVAHRGRGTRDRRRQPRCAARLLRARRHRRAVAGASASERHHRHRPHGARIHDGPVPGRCSGGKPVSGTAREREDRRGRAQSGPARVARVQQGLCVAQIALGMALLAVAGLLAHSLWRLNTVEPGFNSAHVLGFNLSVPNDQPLEDRVRFYHNALEDIRTIPGVERAGLISFLPPETRAGVFLGLAIDGVPPPERGAPPRVANTLITSVGYFSTLEMNIVHGRDFTEADNADGRPVVIVNEALMRQHFPDGDAIGRRIGTGFDSLKPVREVVGVVQDTHDRGVAAEPIPTVYIPFQQFSLPYGSIAVRTGVTPASVVPVIRDRLNRLNPAVPLTDFQTLDTRLRESLREPRFYTLLAATCALMAVLFVTFGLYGLVSYSVSRRTSELGIRMAVGAESGTILRMVLLQGRRMAVLGVAAGLGLAVLLSRALASLLFQVQPLDPLTLSAAAAIVVLVTLAASYAPARRASRVSPIVALRYE